MKEKRDCKIVQDLLPNYMEKLTDKETNQYIEEHLGGCQECKTVYISMNKELGTPKEEITQKKVDGFKKYKNKLNILKTIIICFLLLIVLILCFIVGRKMLIIRKMNTKVNNYTNSNNYYREITQYTGNTICETNYWKKGNKYLSKKKMLSTQEDIVSQTIINYCNGENVNTYIESGNSKIAYLDSEGILNERFSDWNEWLGINNNWDLLKISLFSAISTEKCSQKDCYKLTTRYDPNDSQVIYIEKETGLCLRAIVQNQTDDILEDSIVQYKYIFDNVTDENLIEPDISEYKVQEN